MKKYPTIKKLGSHTYNNMALFLSVCYMVAVIHAALWYNEITILILGIMLSLIILPFIAIMCNNWRYGSYLLVCVAVIAIAYI